MVADDMTYIELIEDLRTFLLSRWICSVTAGPWNSSNDQANFFQYLGESQAVAGRTIFDETLIEDLPIISKSGIILMPGQTIPITFFHVRNLLIYGLETSTELITLKLEWREKSCPNPSAYNGAIAWIFYSSNFKNSKALVRSEKFFNPT